MVHWRGAAVWLCALSLVAPTLAVKFIVPALRPGSERQQCLWSYAMSDTLVVISASASLAQARI